MAAFVNVPQVVPRCPYCFTDGSSPGGAGARSRVLSLALVSRPGILHFEDVEVGAEYESPGRTITESDIVLFAGLSGDFNVLHTDAEYMKSSIFGERIAHGLLVLCIQSGLLGRAMPEYAGFSVAAVKWKFKEPIKIGDTVHVLARVTGKRDAADPKYGLVSIARRVLNQRGEVVQEGDSEHMVERRG